MFLTHTLYTDERKHAEWVEALMQFSRTFGTVLGRGVAEVAREGINLRFLVHTYSASLLPNNASVPLRRLKLFVTFFKLEKKAWKEGREEEEGEKGDTQRIEWVYIYRGVSRNFARHYARFFFFSNNTKLMNEREWLKDIWIHTESPREYLWQCTRVLYKYNVVYVYEWRRTERSFKISLRRFLCVAFLPRSYIIVFPLSRGENEEKKTIKWW